MRNAVRNGCIFCVWLYLYEKQIMDLLKDNPIINIRGDKFVGLEGERYIDYASLLTHIDKKAVQNPWWNNKNIGEGKHQEQSPRIVIRLTESDLHNIVKQSVNMILNESHMSSLYHFVSTKQLHHIFRYGFTLSDEEESWSINPKLPNFLSFSRNRNAVQGFPHMVSKWGGSSLNNEGSNSVIIRIEIDAEQLRNYGKVRPFDFMYYFNDGISSKEDIAQMAHIFPNSEGNAGIYNQPFSQSEERLYSKLKTIPKDKSLLMIKCIDIFADYNNMDDKEYNDFVIFLKWLKKACNNRIKLTVYNNINKFNQQYE
jgi:hypothetical protein